MKITSLGHAGLKLETTNATLLVDPWLSLEGAFLESPMNYDSGIVIIGDGHTLLNLNDSRLSSSQLRGIRAKVGRAIDLLLLQGAGASWYPICYYLETYADRRSSQIATVIARYPEPTESLWEVFQNYFERLLGIVSRSIVSGFRQ